jgi:hypothetical protein
MTPSTPTISDQNGIYATQREKLWGNKGAFSARRRKFFLSKKAFAARAGVGII